MNITSLNEQFGHPEYLVFETDNHGQARVRLSTARSNLTLYLQGAQITSCFLPAASEPQYPVADDLFWVSKSSVYTKGKSIRGGIPICWPWFGPHERPQDRPQHGFARTSEFMVTSASVGNERSQITLKMTRALPTFPEWQLADAPGVDCEVRITLSEQLRMILTTTNHLAHNIEVGSALHSYFLVSDVSQIQVPELQGIEYLDKLQAYKVLVQDQPLQVDREVDRVFRHPPACISLIAALTEVSLALSAVQARAATWPGGVIVPTFSWLGGRTGPFSVQRRVRVTGGASLISMMVLRVSNALKPSGVRYSSGFSGFSSSI